MMGGVKSRFWSTPGTVTAIQALGRLRRARRFHVPLGERAAPALISETQHPQVVVRAVKRPLGVIRVIEGHSHSDREVVLYQQRAVLTAVRPCCVAVLQPGSNDLGAAASHVVALVPGMPAVLGVLGKQCADLAWIIGDPSVVVRVEPPLHHLSVNPHCTLLFDASASSFSAETSSVVLSVTEEEADVEAPSNYLSLAKFVLQLMQFYTSDYICPLY